MFRSFINRFILSYQAFMAYSVTISLDVKLELRYRHLFQDGSGLKYIKLQARLFSQVP